MWRDIPELNQLRIPYRRFRAGETMLHPVATTMRDEKSSDMIQAASSHMWTAGEINVKYEPITKDDIRLYT